MHSLKRSTRGLPLDVKLPLLISSLLFAILALGVLLGYTGVKRAATQAATDRLRLVSQQLSALVAPGIDQAVVRLRRGAENPAVLELFSNADAQSERSAAATLKGLRSPGSPNLPVALLNRDRVPLLVVGDSMRQESVAVFTPKLIAGEGGAGPFFAIGDRAHYWVSSPIRRGGVVVGHVAELRRVGDGSTAKQVEALIGSQISVFFANAEGGRWVTLDGEFVPAPKSWPFLGAHDYSLGGAQGLGHAAAIPKTQFAIVTQQPLDAVLSEPNEFFRRSALAALLLSIAGAVGAWLVSRRITEPVRELREASAAIVRGEYDHRIRVTRKDEFGALGESFNWMADHVEVTHGSLTERFETEHSRVAELERNKRVEAELAERRIRDILDSIADAFFAFDPEMRLKYINGAGERMLELQGEAVLTRNAWEMYPGLKDTPLYEACTRVLGDGRPCDVEQPSDREPGHWLHYHVVPTSDGIAVFVRDITSRKSAEAMLQKMSAAVEASADGIGILSEDGVFQYANRAEAELYGYESADELVGKPWTVLFSDTDSARLRAAAGPSLAASNHWMAEGVGRRRDGSSFPHEFSVTRLDGIGFIRVERDISERKAAELALQESEKLVRQLTDNIGTVFWMKDWSKKEVLHLSVAYERIWGRSVESVYQDALSWTEAVHSDDRDRVLAAVSTQEVQYDEEFRILRPDGEIRWIHDRGYPVHSPDGELYRIAGFAEDITERKQVEEALHAARTEAERANRSKSEFLSRMSHELRTPMNAILGFAQLLELETEGAENQESVHQILRAGRHLLGLIDEVLDLAKIEADRMSMSVEPVLVQRVLDDAVELLRPMAAERGVRLHSEPSDYYVAADQQRLNQILLNLLSNAIKYNREAGEVTISCGSRPENRIRISVTDTGSGISAEMAQRVFRPFDRLGAARTEVQGTGLGLALSKGLVEAMAGSIGFESQEGVGSTFWIELASASEVEERLPTTGSEEDASDALDSPLAGRSVTILYIEDNLSNLYLVERILQRRPGVKLLPAMQGRLGLDLAQKHRPDLILLDLHLPDLQGDEVLRTLRSTPHLAGIPVVVISADATERQIQRLRDAGARDYLTKPFEVQRLLAVVDTLIQEPDGAE